jgi:16S rRNA (guanine527-N7)-methyltransferase
LSFRALLSDEFPLNPVQLDQLESHYRLLDQWNRKINLTRIDRVEDAVYRHYCESIFLGLSLPAGSFTIADIGSGAGFPGIPIAVVRPECRITLIESDKRKAVFLSECSRDLNNIEVIADRVEMVRSRFEWVVSRAVRPTEVLGSGASDNFALLLTEKALRTLPQAMSVMKIPWSTNEVVAMFHVEHERARINPTR